MISNELHYLNAELFSDVLVFVGFTPVHLEEIFSLLLPRFVFCFSKCLVEKL